MSSRSRSSRHSGGSQGGASAAGPSGGSGKSGKRAAASSGSFSTSSCSPANFPHMGVPPVPKIGFNEYRFTWFISDYEIHDYLRADHPRRIISRKFRTQIEEPGVGREGDGGCSQGGTIRNCFWRASFSFCGDGDDHRHLHVHCSSEDGMDVLCLVRIFNKTGENLIGTYYQLERVKKHEPLDFRLDSKTTREMERRRRRSEVSLEIILIIISSYEDASPHADSLLEQVRESEKLQDYSESKTESAVKLSAVRSFNARKQFEQILQPDGNHFSDVTLVVGKTEAAEDGDKEVKDELMDTEPDKAEGGEKETRDLHRFYCHRYLLSQESPVFERMFTGGDGFIENQNGEVVIEDVDPAVMREFLHFVYTGTLEKGILTPTRDSRRGRHFVEALIQVAEKYQVESLKRVCELRVLSTVRNDQMKTRAVVETLVHSHCFNLYRLREILLRFVAWHSDAVLFGSAGSNCDEAERAERMRLVQSYPDLHMELTKLLSALAHKRCPELEMEDSLSENDSSGASSDRFSYSSDDSIGL